MSEFSLSPNTTKKTKYWYRAVMSELFIFCSFILSHPLYFSYLIFFSPYIIKICSFLSPLFITTSLLLLALLNTIYGNEYNSDKLSSDIAAEEENKDYFQQFEEFEAYKIVFDTSITTVESLQLQGRTETVTQTEEESNINGISISEPPPEPVDKHLCHESSSSFSVNSHIVNEISLAEIMRAEGDSESESESKSIHLIAGGGKCLGGFLKEEDNENASCEMGSEKEVKTVSLSVEFNKVEEEEQKAAAAAEFSMKSSGSKAAAEGSIFGSKIISSTEEEGKTKLMSLETNGSSDSISDGEFSWKKNLQNSENSMGSMRKEKEWRRTLACKLFEERHNSNTDATEGMDLLWETYEETTATDHHHSSNKKQQLLTKSKTKKSSSRHHHEDNGDDEEEEEEMDDGQLCCLQALKFSAGKMNLGMGRPNLMKISKTFKGIGWLHNLTKHGKKMYH